MTAPGVRCIDKGQHSWPNTFEADGYMRCQLGCGARRPAKGRWIGPIEGPDEQAVDIEPTKAPQALQEPILCVSANGRHSWPARADRDGWVRCARLGCGAGRRWNERTAHSPEQVPPSPGPFADEELFPDHPATQASAPAEVGMAPHQRLAPCDRCGARMLLERDVDGDLEQVCINGHRRYGRSPEELAAVVEQDTVFAAGKLRVRQPRTGKLRLG